MSDLSWALLSSSCLLVVCLLLLLILLLLRSLLKTTAENQKSLLISQGSSQEILLTLLEDQRSENQALRNQLRASDVVTLNSLNYATKAGPSHSPSPVDVQDEDLDYETELAQQGYQMGGISDDLESSGWPRVILKDGDPVAFDPA